MGSTFTIRLPAELGEAASAPPATPEAVGEKAAESVPADGGEVVLVIDDDAAVRELMQRYLQREGFGVVTASSGAEGLQRARQVRPMAITLDVMMPGMDGWSVLQVLKADPQLAEIPVILVSMVDDQGKGYALGAEDYLTKPVDRERLTRVLGKFRANEVSGPILLVEDNEGMRQVMRRELEKEGLEVVEAENGQVALERVAAAQPRLILLDLMMPEMDGFAFVEALRNNPAWHSIPMVVVTGKDLLAEERERLNGYVEQVLQKGARQPRELMNQIVALVQRSR